MRYFAIETLYKDRSLFSREIPSRKRDSAHKHLFLALIAPSYRSIARTCGRDSAEPVIVPHLITITNIVSVSVPWMSGGVMLREARSIFALGGVDAAPLRHATPHHATPRRAVLCRAEPHRGHQIKSKRGLEHLEDNKALSTRGRDSIR